MTVDNFDAIKLLLPKQDTGLTYQVQILQRRKDNNPGAKMAGNNCARSIKNFYINTARDLEAERKFITQLCQATNSRAYINLNAKSVKLVMLGVIAKTTEYLKSGFTSMKSYSRIVDSEVAKVKPQEHVWVLDIDDPSRTEECASAVVRTGGRILASIPTVSGCHILTSKFNTKEFNELIPEGEEITKKNASTLLYYEKIDN